MIYKKLILSLFYLSTLTSCAQNVALLGPAYTVATSGNIYQAGLAYTSDSIIINTTGKSTSQNLKKILSKKRVDTEFEKLVKRNIKKTRKKLKLSNQ